MEKPSGHHPVFQSQDIRTIRLCHCRDILLEIGPLYLRFTPKAASHLKRALESALVRLAEEDKAKKKASHLTLVSSK